MHGLYINCPMRSLQRKLTERGRLTTNSKAGVVLEGCNMGFCVASYEGTEVEQDILRSARFVVTVTAKVRA